MPHGTDSDFSRVRTSYHGVPVHVQQHKSAVAYIEQVCLNAPPLHLIVRCVFCVSAYCRAGLWCLCNPEIRHSSRGMELTSSTRTSKRLWDLCQRSLFRRVVPPATTCSKTRSVSARVVAPDTFQGPFTSVALPLKKRK